MINEATFDNAIDLAPLHTFTTLFDLPHHDIEALLNQQTTDYNTTYFEQHEPTMANDYYCYSNQYQYNEQYSYSPTSSTSSSPGPIGDMFGFYDNYQSQYPQYDFNPQPSFVDNSTPPAPSRKMRPAKRTSPTSTVYAQAEKDVDIDSLIVRVRSARVKLGFTQAEFAKSMKYIFKRSFSQTTVCRFEGKQLTKQNMLKLVPLFDKWLAHCSQDIEFVKKSIF